MSLFMSSTHLHKVQSSDTKEQECYAYMSWHLYWIVQNRSDQLIQSYNGQTLADTINFTNR